MVIRTSTTWISLEIAWTAKWVGMDTGAMVRQSPRILQHRGIAPPKPHFKKSSQINFIGRCCKWSRNNINTAMITEEILVKAYRCSIRIFK